MSLVFSVRRQEAELVAPAKPTPRELKPLSDLDSSETARFHMPGMMIYRNNPSMKGKDPVRVIREATAQALVFYYPYAGRLREGPARRLLVDCTGEGVMFVEADADVTLDDFGPVLWPPFPCFEELVYNVPGSDGILHCPLVLIQVTRLRCGGFIFGVRLNHTMSDAFGMAQFLMAIGEMARGAVAPSIPPCWNREFFHARDPPRAKLPLPDYDGEISYAALYDDMIQKTFFFGPSQVSALRTLVPNNLRDCSAFDIITACLWRCRTVALNFNPKHQVHVVFAVNARGLNLYPPIPNGYYGNVVLPVIASTTVENLCNESLGNALELVRKAKQMTEECVRSMIDLIAIKGYSPIPGMKEGLCFVVSDLKMVDFSDIDVGWGKAEYGGSPISLLPGLGVSYTSYKNHKGDDGRLVQLYFPPTAMQIFESELNNMLNHKHYIKSAI